MTETIDNSTLSDADEQPRPRRKHRHYSAVVRHRCGSFGKVQVFCYMLGAWRCVYSDDDRTKAQQWAAANIRREGSAVTAIELRERGNGGTLIWRAEAGDA
jgi:hypothetical protein